MVSLLASARDAFDLELGVVLAVALVLLVVLAPPHLEDLDLVVPALREDRCRHRGARHEWLTEADAIAIADHEHLIDDHFRAHVRRYLFYLELFAGGNFVLLAAGFYDRVHEERLR